jgi:hypothetical protein
MRRWWMGFILIAFGVTANAGSNPREAFLLDVLDALHEAHWASQTEPVNGDVHSLVAAYLNQNRRYEDAYKAIEKYTNDGDAVHEVVGNKIAAGALDLMTANNDLMEALAEPAAGAPADPREVMAKAADLRKKAWTSIAVGAVYVASAIIEPTESAPTSGPLPYRLSKEERQAVTDRLDALFSDELERLRAFRAGRGDARDQPYVAYAVDKIRGYLTAETYEAAAAAQ